MKYDAILCIDNDILCEAIDDRMFAATPTMGAATQTFHGPKDWDDPKLYTSFNFGRSLRSQLSDVGNGFSCKVNDFGKWVTVEMTHNNQVTGRSASKTFLIVFKQKGNGLVLSTHNRYRTISGVDQAVSYIRSASSSLQSATGQKIG